MEKYVERQSQGTNHEPAYGMSRAELDSDAGDFATSLVKRRIKGIEDKTETTKP